MLSDHLLAAAARQTSTENVQSGGEVSAAARVWIHIDPSVEPLAAERGYNQELDDLQERLDPDAAPPEHGCRRGGQKSLRVLL